MSNNIPDRIPVIRPGMKKVKELAKEFHASHVRITDAFYKAKEKDKKFTGADGGTYPLVEWVRPGKMGRPGLALSEKEGAIEALNTFMLEEFGKPLRVFDTIIFGPAIQDKRPGMKRAVDVGNMFHMAPPKILACFKIAIKQGKKFKGNDGKDYPLVERVIPPGQKRPGLFLSEKPGAMKAFKAFIQEENLGKTLKNSNDIPMMRPGMKRVMDIARQFHASHIRIREAFMRALKKNYQFTGNDGNVYPLVEWGQPIKSGRPGIALSEKEGAIEALNAFMLEEFGKPLTCVVDDRMIGMAAHTARPGMADAFDVAKKLYLNHFQVREGFRAVFKRKKKFTGPDGKEYPLVEWARVPGHKRPMLFLSETPGALEAFEKFMWAEILYNFKEGQNIKDIPIVRPGMKHVSELAKEFQLEPLRIKIGFHMAFKKQEKFIGTDGHVYPLIELVKFPKWRRHNLVLSEKPGALEALETFMQEVFVPKKAPSVEIREVQNTKNAMMIRPGMKRVRDLAKEFHMDHIRIGKGFLKALKKKETFMGTDGKEYPLVEWVKAETNAGRPGIALSEKPGSLEAFKAFMQKEFVRPLKKDKSASLPPIRPGMKRVGEFSKEFHVDHVRIKRCFERALEKNKTFKGTDGGTYPLVEQVMSVTKIGRPGLALSEKPGALEALADFMREEFGKPLKVRYLSPEKEMAGKVPNKVAEQANILPHKVSKQDPQILQEKTR